MSWQSELMMTRGHWEPGPTLERQVGFIVLRKIGGDQAAIDAIWKMASHVRLIDERFLEIHLSRGGSPEEGIPNCTVKIRINPDRKRVDVSLETHGAAGGSHLLFRDFLRDIERTAACDPDGITFLSRTDAREITIRKGGEIYSGVC